MNQPANVRIWNRTRIADAISNLTSPPLVAVPTYVVLGLHDQARLGFSSARLLVALSLAILLGVIWPIGYVLYLKSRAQISDLMIPLREQRTLPYLAAIAAFGLAFGLIYALLGGGSLAAIMLASAVNGLIVLFINFYWKISAHATGLAGPLAALTSVYGWPILPLYVLLPLVDWARVYLKAHTLGQVIAGSLFGLACTAVQFELFFRPLGWL